MRKCYCDSCEEEIKGHPHVVNVPCHLYSMRNRIGYADGAGNPISGRTDSIDLCNACLNKFYEGAVNAIGGPK